MEQHRLKFALFGNIYQTKKSASIQKVLACLSEHDAEIYVDKEYYDFLTLDQRIGVEANGIFEGNDFQADFVISMGGDGTFLKAASRVREKMIPILGVNMGRLGFLADVSPSEIEQCVKALYAVPLSKWRPTANLWRAIPVPSTTLPSSSVTPPR